MKIAFLLCLLLITFHSNGQPQTNNFVAIDRRAKIIDATSIDSLSYKLTKPYKTQLDKVRSIFRWITEHIEYDVKGYHNPKGLYNDLWAQSASVSDSLRMDAYYAEIAKRVFTDRKSVCEGYAILFKAICDKAGIPCVIITGDARLYNDPIGNITGNEHAWNAVFFNNKWQLLDVTWASGYVTDNVTKFTKEYDDFYFLTSPFKMLNNHYPSDPKWTLYPNPPSKERFYSFPYVHKDYYTSNIRSFYPLNGLLEVSIAHRTVRIELETSDKNKELSISEYPLQNNNVSADSTLSLEEYSKKHAPKYKIDGTKIYWDYEIQSYKTERLDITYNDKLILSYKVKIYR